MHGRKKMQFSRGYLTYFYNWYFCSDPILYLIIHAAAITIMKNSQIECSKEIKEEITNVLAIDWRFKNHI
jgi:hypothetical protein